MSISKRPLSGNALKILAAIFMTLDHMGLMLFPHIPLLRILGRLALPIFAFMIAEGCKYTRDHEGENRKSQTARNAEAHLRGEE